MAAWGEIEHEAPELCALARRYLDAHAHKTLATLRRDGSPRISGIEMKFQRGEAWLGMMWGSLKARDLQRDPRFALHSGSDEPAEWTGDAKLAGTAVEVTDPTLVEELNGAAPADERTHLFRLDVTELAVVRLGDPRDHLVVESWHEGRGVERRERR